MEGTLLKAVSSLFTTRSLLLIGAVMLVLYVLARTGNDPISAGQRARVAA